MNKVTKTFVAILLIGIVLSGVVYAVTVISNKISNNYVKNNTNHHVIMNPTYQSTLDEKTVNNLWVGTLDLAWKDLKEKIKMNTIEIEGGNPKIADELNKSTFSKYMLDSNDYEINVKRTATDGYIINATLNKELNFLEVFDNFSNDYTQMTFGNNEEYIKYFGINNASPEEMNKNVEDALKQGKIGIDLLE